MLADLAEHAKETTVRIEATSKLTDQTLLAKIVLESDIPGVRTAAAAKLTDPAVLTKVALEDAFSPAREEAVLRLTLQAVLGRVALEDTDASVRTTAVEKLTSQDLLAKIAMEDNHKDVRKAAVERLTDQTVLAKAALADKDENVRKAAVENLTDQQVLTEVALQDKVPPVYQAAATKVIDPTVRASFMGKYCRSAAAFMSSAMSISKTLEHGMSSAQFGTQLSELTENLRRISWAPDAEKLIQFGTKIVEQYNAAAANVGSGQGFIMLSEDNGVLSRTMVGHIYSGPNDPGPDLTSRTSAIVQSNLQAAHENTQRMLTMFNKILLEQPADVRHDVNQELRGLP